MAIFTLNFAVCPINEIPMKSPGLEGQIFKNPLKKGYFGHFSTKSDNFWPLHFDPF